MSSPGLPSFGNNRIVKFTSVFESQSPPLKALAQSYCTLSTQREATRAARVEKLQEILRALNFPELDAKKQQVVKAVLKLPGEGPRKILATQGVDYDALKVKLAVEAEIRAIQSAPDRWNRLRGLTGGAAGPSRVSGPPLLLLEHAPKSTGFMREAYDPQHRAWGQQEGMQPLQTWDHQGAGSLFDWADEQEATGNMPPLSRMQYMSPAQAAFCRLSFDRGRLLAANGHPYSSDGNGARWDIFVMDRNGHFYVGTHIPSRLHHSCFLAGGPVKCAGELMVHDGELLAISDRSGHYRPGHEHMFTLLRILAFMHRVNLSRVRLELYKRDDNGQMIAGAVGFEIETLNALEALQNWQKKTVVVRMLAKKK